MRRVLGILALGLVLVGCSKGATTETPPTTPPPTTTAADPVALLRGAMLKSIATTLHMEGSVTSGGQKLNFVADTDAMSRSMDMKMTGLITMEARVIGQDFYLKLAALGGKPWTHLDLTKLPATSSIRQSTDFASQLGLMGGVVSAESTGAGRYKGIADLDKAAAAASPGVRPQLEAAAAQAKNPSEVPFEAAVDSEGRLTELSYTLDTKAAGKVDTVIEMSDFGDPVTVSPPPAADVQEASADLYSRL